MCLKVFECIVCECECGQVGCVVLSVTVLYLGNAQRALVKQIEREVEIKPAWRSETMPME